jgi:hypothetical protein
MSAPFPADHTEVGGLSGSFNENESTPGETPEYRRASQENSGEMQPVERHSPVVVRVPGWREFILGRSGGVYLDE